MKKAWIAATFVILVNSSVFSFPNYDEFFSSKAASLDMKKNGIFPKGEKLLFSVYSIGSSNDDWSKEGFSSIGPYYGDQTGSQFAPYGSIIEAAKAINKYCIYRVGMQIPFLHSYKMPNEKDITESLRKQIEAVASSKEIIAWYLTPEELRSWKSDEMRYLEIATSAIRKYDPLKRPIMMYEPNQRQAGDLAKTIRYLDFCVKGIYTNTSGYQDKRIWVKWSVEQEMKAIKSEKSNALPIAVLWMGVGTEKYSKQVIKNWIRHDVYLSLITGAKGILVWSGFRRKEFTNFDDYLEGYSEVACELNCENGLSSVLLFGEIKRDIIISSEGQDKVVKLTIGKETEQYEAISSFEVAYKESRYLILVNSANNALDVKIANLPQEEFYRKNIFLSESISELTKDNYQTKMQPYEVQCWKFDKAN